MMFQLCIKAAWGIIHGGHKLNYVVKYVIKML